MTCEGLNILLYLESQRRLVNHIADRRVSNAVYEAIGFLVEPNIKTTLLYLSVAKDYLDYTTLMQEVLHYFDLPHE